MPKVEHVTWYTSDSKQSSKCSQSPCYEVLFCYQRMTVKCESDYFEFIDLENLENRNENQAEKVKGNNGVES